MDPSSSPPAPSGSPGAPRQPEPPGVPTPRAAWSWGLLWILLAAAATALALCGGWPDFHPY